MTIINHPTEGLLFAGEEKLCRKLKELVAKEDIDKELMEESMRSGNNLNHSCTRGDKEELMSKVYDCLLPPLPMPFSEFCNSPTTMLSSHFSRVLEVEMAGLRYKGVPCRRRFLSGSSGIRASSMPSEERLTTRHFQVCSNIIICHLIMIMN